MVKPLIQTWDTKKCTGCMSDFPVHKDWQTQPLQCGPCRLITRKFVDAVEYLLRESGVISHPETKKVLLKLVQDASALYRKKKLDGEDPRRAWRTVERKLAHTIWSDKTLRKIVLLTIKELKIQAHGDARADKRNQKRSARLLNGTRRWSG